MTPIKHPSNPRGYTLRITFESGHTAPEFRAKLLPIVSWVAELKKLTDVYISGLRPQKDRYTAWDGNGFGVRVSTKGRKSFVGLYRFNGKPRRITYGPYRSALEPAGNGRLSLAEAREKHAVAMKGLEGGIDPGRERIQGRIDNRQAPTVNDLAHEYMERYAKVKKKSWGLDEKLLNKDLLPAIGNQKARTVRKRDIVLILDRVVDRGAPITANRLLAVTRKMFNFAVSRDLIEISPCIGMGAPSPENRRERTLSHDEIRALWRGLDEVDVYLPAKQALRFLLATGQRKMEACKAKWSHIENGTWLIPSENSKNGHEHRVPLSELALSILEEVRGLDPAWIFPAPRSKAGHLDAKHTNYVLDKVMAGRAMSPFTTHDLRRTCYSELGRLGFNRLIQDKIANHIDGSVGGIYDQYNYRPEMRQALDAWADALIKVIKGDKAEVVRMPVERLG